MLINQLSIFIENRKGRLEEITRILGENDIDIRALSIADTTDYGILRLIVNDSSKAEQVLSKNNITVSITKVLAIAVSNTPGGLHGAIKVLSSNDIEIEYMYAFINPKKDAAFVVIRVEDNDKASEILQDGGISMLQNSDLELN